MPGEVESLPEATRAFYRRALAILGAEKIPFLIGGAFAYREYTGISRFTKDLDVFLRPADRAAACRALANAGLTVEERVLHWLSKAHDGDDYVDLITGFGNGVGAVDDGWFRHAREGSVFDVPVRLAPPEEMLWSYAFVMERERFDGAEIAHLLHEQAQRLDWERVLERFGEHWRLLLAHVVIFGFVYPARDATIPRWVLDLLLQRLDRDRRHPARDSRLCRGTLLSGKQFLVDVEERGYEDARAPFAREIPDTEAHEP